MATQAHSLPAPVTGNGIRPPSQGLISRILPLIVQPTVFFLHLLQLALTDILLPVDLTGPIARGRGGDTAAF